jgi:hypothetical protein
MLDTLKLVLDEYEVEPGADLELQPASFNAGSGDFAPEYQLWRSGSQVVRGVKAWHNSERINISLKPRREAPTEQGLCTVQFSVPKLATGSNYFPTDERGTQGALDDVGKYLGSMGIKTNMERATLARLDAAQTHAMREPFDGYLPVLSRLQGKRAQRREYGGMMLWGNTQWEICGYDKLEELRRLKRSVAGLPVNSLRMELRALRGQKVKSLFGLRSVAELRDGLDHVREVYRSEMERQLFKHELPEESLLSSSDLVEQLRAAQEVSPHWYQTWKSAFAMQQLAPQMEALKHAVRVVAPNRETAYRIIKQLEQGEREGLALQKIGPSSRTWGERYNELRDKVLA